MRKSLKNKKECNIITNTDKIINFVRRGKRKRDNDIKIRDGERDSDITLSTFTRNVKRRLFYRGNKRNCLEGDGEILLLPEDTINTILDFWPSNIYSWSLCCKEIYNKTNGYMANNFRFRIVRRSLHFLKNKTLTRNKLFHLKVVNCDIKDILGNYILRKVQSIIVYSGCIKNNIDMTCFSSLSRITIRNESRYMMTLNMVPVQRQINKTFHVKLGNNVKKIIISGSPSIMMDPCNNIEHYEANSFNNHIGNTKNINSLKVLKINSIGGLKNLNSIESIKYLQVPTIECLKNFKTSVLESLKGVRFSSIIGSKYHRILPKLSHFKNLLYLERPGVLHMNGISEILKNLVVLVVTTVSYQDAVEIVKLNNLKILASAYNRVDFTRIIKKLCQSTTLTVVSLRLYGSTRVSDIPKARMNDLAASKSIKVLYTHGVTYTFSRECNYVYSTEEGSVLVNPYHPPYKYLDKSKKYYKCVKRALNIFKFESSF